MPTHRPVRNAVKVPFVDEGLKEIARYLSEGEAFVACGLLESAGIEATVFTESHGLEGPRHGRLMVANEDVLEACVTLDLVPPDANPSQLPERVIITVGLVLAAIAVVFFVRIFV